MSKALNYCVGGGYIVGPSYELPDDPSGYCSDDRDVIGCNALVCSGCGARVRHLLGVAPEPPPNTNWSTVYDTADWSTLGWLKPTTMARWYVCRCTQTMELHSKPSNQLEETKGITWRCAGHPPSPLPLEIDGVQITRFTDVTKLLRDAATRVVKISLGKIYAHLRGTPLQAQFERTVESFLTDDDARVRRVALGFYWGHPDAPGGAKVLALAEGDRALFRGVPDEALSEGTDLEARLMLTLGQLWISGSVDEDRAQSQLRTESQRLGRLRPTLAALAQKDTEWLMAQAEALLQLNPDQTGKLIIELERVLGSIPQLLELATRCRPNDADARATARNDIESYVTSALRDPLLDVLA